MIEKYRPLFIHLNPASIPEVVAHMQKYLTEHTFVTVEEFGAQFQEYIDAHPDIIKVGSVNGLTGDVVLTSENITMTGGTSESIGTVIGDILEEASSTGETVDDLVVDMDAVKSDIVTLENVFTGATEESSGVKGLVPAPANTQTSHYLKATGDFEAITAREVVSVSIPDAGTVEAALTELNTLVGNAGKNFYYTPSSISLDVNSIVLGVTTKLYNIQFPDDGLYLIVLYPTGEMPTGGNMIMTAVGIYNFQPIPYTTENFFSGEGVMLARGGVDIQVLNGAQKAKSIYIRYAYVRIK